MLYALFFGEVPSLRSFLGSKVPCATLAKRMQAVLTVRKTMAKAQAQLKLKRACERKSPKMKYHIYSSGDEMLVWQEKLSINILASS